MRPRALAPESRVLWNRMGSCDSRPVIAVLGCGGAAQRLCERWVELGASDGFRILLFETSARPGGQRVRPGRTRRSQHWYRKHGFELHLEHEICAVDRQHRLLVSLEGKCFDYDTLVFATGSGALVPSPALLRLPHVFCPHDPEQELALLDAADRCARRGGVAAVLGGGVQGIETARGLQLRGCSVMLVERAPYLLPRQLPLAASRSLEAQLRTLGLELRLATVVRDVQRCRAGLRIDLGARDPIEVELLALAVGTRPCDDLAREAGLRCHPAGGIVVDHTLRTTDPRVFAIGACARQGGLVTSQPEAVRSMADALADRLLERPSSFAGCLPELELQLPDVDLAAIGDSSASDRETELIAHGSRTAMRALVLRAGRVVGALRVGPWEEWPRIRELVRSGARVPRRRRERFRRSGTLAHDGIRLGVSRLWSALARGQRGEGTSRGPGWRPGA